MFTHGAPGQRAMYRGAGGAGWSYGHEIPAYLREVMQSRGGSGSGDAVDLHDVVWLNEADGRDLWRMVREHPTLAFAIQESQKRLFAAPFEIAIGGMMRVEEEAKVHAIPLTEMTAEFREQVIERFWMPFLKQVDLRRRAFGFAPYYFEPVPVKLEQAMRRRAEGRAGLARQARGRTLVHYVPRTPPVGSGDTGTRIRDGHQELVWIWHPRAHTRLGGQVDPRMQWMVETLPTHEGRYRSQLAGLLADWRYVERMRALDVRVSALVANPRGVITYTPDVGRGTGSGGGGAGGVNATTYLAGAGASATFPGPSWERGGAAGPSPLEQVDDFREEQLAGDSAIMTGDGMLGAPLYDAASITIDPEHEEAVKLDTLLRNNPAYRGAIQTRGARHPPNSYPLHPYENYHPLPPPRPVAPNLMQHMARLDRYAALVAGYPLDQVVGAAAGSASGSSDLAGGSGSGALASDEGTNRHVVADLKALVKFYSAFVRDAYLQAYSVSFKRAKKQVARRVYRRAPQAADLVDFDSVLEVQVTFPRVPIAAPADLAFMYSVRAIDADDFYRHTLPMYGLDESQGPPRGYRAALDAHYPARPLELQQLDLQREAQEAQIALQRQQHALQAQQQKEQLALQKQQAAAESTEGGSAEGGSAEGGKKRAASERADAESDHEADSPKPRKRART